MRIVVYPHSMEIGGSQRNAVDLAAAVRDRGHDVIVISEPGPLVERVHALGLERIEVPRERRRPSLPVARQLARLVHERRLDVVHGYEWPPVLDACLGPGLARGTAVVGTVMSMSVVPFFPRTVPLVVGTELIRQAAIEAGHRHVTLIEPPVDTEADRPGIDAAGFRGAHGVAADELLCAIVCRLVPELKLEGLLAACAAVGRLASDGRRIRLAVVGGGTAREQVAAAAAEANRAAGHEVVFLTGELSDPTPAYAAADVIVGQGGSALRGMAFGKPLVVVGGEGFSELVTPQSTPLFLDQGWYGLGPGTRGAGVPALCGALQELADSAARRAELGAYGRDLVVGRFSLTQAAAILEAEYRASMASPAALRTAVAELARCAPGLVGTKLQRHWQSWRGTVAVDDANAQVSVRHSALGGSAEPAGLAKAA